MTAQIEKWSNPQHESQKEDFGFIPQKSITAMFKGNTSPKTNMDTPKRWFGKGDSFKI